MSRKKGNRKQPKKNNKGPANQQQEHWTQPTHHQAETRAEAPAQPLRPESRMTRDQRRALCAFRCVGNVDKDDQPDYKILVNGFGANVMRSGLVAAMAFLEREKERSGPFREDLHKALLKVEIPCVKKAPDLAAQIRELELDDYILVTREILKIALWFKRAVQAKFTDDKGEQT